MPYLWKKKKERHEFHASWVVENNANGSIKLVVYPVGSDSRALAEKRHSGGCLVAVEDSYPFGDQEMPSALALNAAETQSCSGSVVLALDQQPWFDY